MKTVQKSKMLIQSYSVLTKRILLDQETTLQTNLLRKLLGSFFIILSVAILFTDKVTTFGLTESYGYRNPETFIWMITQSLSPILFIFGALLKPYRFFYFVPIYIYFIQIYWVFDHTLKIDDPILHLYAIGFSIGAFVFFCLFIYLTKQLTKTNLILIKNIKKSVRHIAVFISSKYIDKLPKKDQENYNLDTEKYMNSLDKSV